MMWGIAGVGALLLFVVARQLELQGRPERWVALVLIVLIIESFVYPSQIGTPTGPFRIPLLGGSLRTHDILVAIGLLARATVRPLPTRLRGGGVLWFVTGVWFATAALRGVVSGHGTNVVLFQTGSVLGLFGGYLLVSGCDPTRLAALFRPRYLVVTGLLLLFVLPNEALEEPNEYFGTGFGTVSVDSASVFVAFAFVAVLIEWSRRPRSTSIGWFCIPLLVAPFTIEQRATLLHLAASLMVVLVAVVSAEWNNRVDVKRIELLWGAMLAVGVMMGVLVVSLSGGEGTVPLAGYYESTFQGESQELSAQARRESFSVGIDEWQEQAAFGHGLGHTYRIQRPGSADIVEPATFDNVPLDVLVRTGIVGLVLFVAANASSVVRGWRVWTRSSDATISAFALAATVVIVGLWVKAGFESILEKGKLALVWGMAAGAISSAAHHLEQREPTDQRAREIPLTGGIRRWT